VIAALLAGLASAREPPADPTLPWEREIAGVELLIVQPVIGRVLYLQRRPDVRWPAPVEGAIGHVALRLIDDGPVEQQWTVMMSAYMDRTGDGVDDPTNVITGIFGGYDLKLVVQPLPELARTYAYEHERWMRRYVLPMTPEQIDLLLVLVRDASEHSEAHTLGGYYFFGENCSTEITQLLDVALLGKDRELNYPFTLPRKYRKRGRVTPPVHTVTPDETKSGDIERAWAAPPEVGRACAAGDADCAAAWVAAARETFGQEWIDEMARLSRRRAYERRWSPELRRALAEASGE
jgi:hypothetical protein